MSTITKKTPPRFFVVKLHHHFAGTRSVSAPAFVAVEARTHSGEWYSFLGPATKAWKTARGAQRWLDERPKVLGQVEELPQSQAYALRVFHE